jgi:hypothetical protein
LKTTAFTWLAVPLAFAHATEAPYAAAPTHLAKEAPYIDPTLPAWGRLDQIHLEITPNIDTELFRADDPTLLGIDLPPPAFDQGEFNLSLETFQKNQDEDSSLLNSRLLREQTSNSTLQFWQAPVPPATSGALSDSNLAELTRHTQLKRKGPLSYGFKLGLSSIYDDNITLSSEHRRGDMQFSLTPSGRVLLGSDDSLLRLALNYNGAASWFARTPAQRTYEQNTALEGGWSGSRLKTSFRLGYQDTHNGSADAGERVGRRISYAGVTATYTFSEKTSGELGADVTRARFNDLLGSNEYRAQQFLNYQFTPKTQFGIGASEGILQPDAGRRQTYEQGLLRIVTQPTAKLGFNLSTGAEMRQFDSGKDPTVTPVYTANASWQATAQTTLSLEGRRRTFSSAALQHQNYEATNVALTAREMLSTTMDASVSVGAERADYKSADLDVAASRKDTFLFNRYGFSWAIRRNCSFETFYEYSRNISKGAESHSFRRNRIGVSLNFSF